MASRAQILLPIFSLVYLMTLSYTNLSLSGFWTDIIFSILLALLSLKALCTSKSVKIGWTILLKVIHLLLVLYIFLTLWFQLLQPRALDTFKLRSFLYVYLEGRSFNAYFQPVGAYSGGEGNLSIAENYSYCPIFERERHYKHAILWDFRTDEFDGQAVDQKQIVKTYIKHEVIDKE